ncbi:HAD family acid phosphatase [Nocardioides bigeumensis]|uniref:Acid phosphatase of HAD superfamily subfamily IIIB n=1 Tax=Nocardioides bigeumensis TaxID=433657 RepID=A0ABN2XZV2_9ACTN
MRSPTQTFRTGLGAATALAVGATLVGAAPSTGATDIDSAAITPKTSFTMKADGSSGTATKGNRIPNLDIVKKTVRTYYNATNGIADKTTSPYITEMKAIQDAQAAYLDQAFTTVTAAGKIPAIVLDTDDTTLWNYDMEDGAMGFHYDPALQNTWVQEQRFPATPGMVAFANAAAAKGFAVFGITGRGDSQRTATLANLTKVGYTAFAPERFFTKWPGTDKPAYVTCAVVTACTTVEYKAGTRKHIETDLTGTGGKSYDIVLNVGDQWSDLMGGYADKTLKLPNPTYYLPSPNLPGVSEPALAPKTQFTMLPDGSSGATVGGENIPNIDSTIATIRAYYNAKDGIARRSRSAFVKELRTATRAKAAKIKTQCKKADRPRGRHKTPAVVFDVDDTLLWTYDLQDAGSGFAGDAALRKTWVKKKKFQSVPTMAKMVRKAKRGGCAVIAITERPVDELAQTRKNLNKRFNWVFSKNNVISSTNKAATRAQLKQTRRLRILWNVGDQPADLLGGHAEHRFQVPNPTYYQP